MPLWASVWRADVGRVRLYLLDSDIEENDDAGRMVTDRLYGGDTEHRLRQEILLGVGGVRALQGLGEETQVFHTNEGHAGFMGLERIRQFIVNDGLNFAEAVEAARASTVFTTHTPVPAGIDLFPRPLMEKYFTNWASECGITMDELMALGHAPNTDADAPFNMAVMGLHLVRSEQRRVEAPRLGQPEDVQRPVSRREGRGGPYRLGHERRARLHLGQSRGERPPHPLSRAVLARGRRRDLAARRDTFPTTSCGGCASRAGAGWSTSSATACDRQVLAKSADADTTWCDEALDSRILTIGFARRFATYKRAALLISQPERLEAMLLSVERPIQLVFAGKAHPADDTGKELIRSIAQYARRSEVRHRIAFIEDYDIAVARTLYQGADVWLNTPRRPLEACGTSGEKAALNGGLNCSILDGWWAEMYDGTNGWAISSAEDELDLDKRDLIEAESLFDTLEQQVVPLFYDRSHGGPLPRGWCRRVKASLRTLGPEVEASRMVRDYVTEMYEPAAERRDAMAQAGWARARALAAWKERVSSAWDGVAVVNVDGDGDVADVGSDRQSQRSSTSARSPPKTLPCSSSTVRYDPTTRSTTRRS